MAKASLTPEIFSRVMLLRGTVFLNNISKLTRLGAKCGTEGHGAAGVPHIVQKTGLMNTTEFWKSPWIHYLSWKTASVLNHLHGEDLWFLM